jgi:dCTP diphosphatase
MEKFEEITLKIKEFNKVRDWDKYHNTKDLILALMTEVGELAEIYKWLNNEEVDFVQKDLEKKKRIEEELADIMNYIIVISYKLDINLLKSLEDKLEKNKLKYPVDKIKGNHSNKYV